ncbi:hypothetical protein E8E13_004905 [Curvularia kusanoi]|uniref:AA1-like domain-containing protein n=1 Tax=Curvularia kusanoi TaxID=90978 RepID=A0A9P4T7C2_CURKU|nr:hypothetical protein E8E13_004905 [Curvularia kusanoi]
MQFFTVASALFAAALAVPTPQTTDCPNPAHCPSTPPPNPDHYENIDITDFYVRKNDGIQGASFKLSGKNATDLECSIGATTLPSKVVTCGDSDYRFGLTKGDTTEFGLAIYHQTSPFAGLYAIGDAPTYCHAGGNGPDDFVCQQIGALTIVIVDQNYPSPN